MADLGFDGRVAVITGAGIIECFALATYLEENARRQYMAMQIGEPYVFSEAEQQASMAEWYGYTEELRSAGESISW